MQQTSEEKLEHWRQIIESADASPLGIPEWCRQNDITTHQLAYWRGKIKSHRDICQSFYEQTKEKVADLAGIRKSPFIEMSIDDPTIDIEYPEKPASPTPLSAPVRTMEPVTAGMPEIRIETSSFKIYVTNGVDEQTLRMVLRVTADA